MTTVTKRSASYLSFVAKTLIMYGSSYIEDYAM